MDWLRLSMFAGFTITAACGGKDDTSETSGGTTAVDATAPPDTTMTPMTEGEPTTSAAGSSGPGTSTGGCSGDCGIVVMGPSSVCDENDPTEVPPSLTAKAGAAGTIDVTEAGYETSCCLTLTPAVAVEGMSINLSYTESGDPCDCICYYTIQYTLTEVPSGSWDVVSGSQSVPVDVP